MDSLIKIKNLRKRFKSGKTVVNAVDDVSLDIEQGKNIGIVGESGSGKSTLARLIVKLCQSDGGEILFQGKNIVPYSQRKFRPLRQDVQMVFQDPYSSLDPRLTVRKILAEAWGLVAHQLCRKDREARMIATLEAVGLSGEDLIKYPHEFSGGERQRIAIARALIMKPKLLILDEAVSSLDVLVQVQIIDLLHSIQRDFGVTYMFISHNLRVVKKLCTEIVVMYQGMVVERAHMEELFSNPLHSYTKNLLQAAIDYKSADDVEIKNFTKNSRLIDEGNGHFVLK